MDQARDMDRWRRMYKKWHHFKQHPGEVFATWGSSAMSKSRGRPPALLKGLCFFQRKSLHDGVLKWGYPQKDGL